MFNERLPVIEPKIIARDEHCISRANISNQALKVLYRLRDAGYEAYLVGGGVRDLLLGLSPKDFDIATSATPEQVAETFRNCRLIGRRFRLAHVHFGREVIEVATFRGLSDAAAVDDDEGDGERVLENGRLVRDNIYGCLEEDALRRDFSINALYYSIEDFAIRDYAGGVADIEQRVIRLMGDPAERYREDPVRMLRASRFAVKLDFDIDPATRAPIAEMADLLADIPPARLFDELLKLLMAGAGLRGFRHLEQLGLLAPLLPATARCLADGEGREVIEQALANTDARIAEDKPVTPAFLFAALLWPVYKRHYQRAQSDGMAPVPASDFAADITIEAQIQHIAIPRRFSSPMREIWRMQPRFERTQGKRVLRFLEHRRFRAAYDFLLLREHEDPSLHEQVVFWTDIQKGPEAQERLATAAPAKKPRARRRRRGGGNNASE
jgi:poly(A) polymerase